MSIWESGYWKDDLGKLADKLESRQIQRRWPDESSVGVEREAFMGAYITRKLAESMKLSWRTLQLRLEVTSYPSVGRRVTWWNRSDVSELYDWSRPIQESRSLMFVCNLLIHSYVFGTVNGTDPSFPRGLSAVLVNSDRNRNRRVYEISAAELVLAFRTVAGDPGYPLDVGWDEAKGDYAAYPPTGPGFSLVSREPIATGNDGV
jgi:hypothetical protein